jgi:hypothetical protein
MVAFVAFVILAEIYSLPLRSSKELPWHILKTVRHFLPVQDPAPDHSAAPAR